MTIVFFLAVFSGLELSVTSAGHIHIVVFIVSVFMGSAIWWFTLSSGINILRKKIKSENHHPNKQDFRNSVGRFWSSWSDEPPVIHLKINPATIYYLRHFGMLTPLPVVKI